MIRVSVVIATYRDTERLNKCLKALNCQTFPRDQFEVIVINNDAENDIHINIEHSFYLKILKESNPGSYIARNMGIEHSTGEIIAFTDSDAIPEADWLEKGVDFFQGESSSKIIVAGKIQLTFENENVLSLAECYEKYFAFPHQRLEKECLAGMVAGNVFISSRTFSEIGLFNGKLLSGGDSEFSYRALENDYLIKYNPKCVVYHPSKHLISDLLKKRRRIFGGKVFRKIHLEDHHKIKSLVNVLIHQTKRYLGELILVFRMPLDKPFSDRLKLIITIKLILMSLLYESAAFIIANRVRRR